MHQQTSVYKDGLAGERNPDTLHHHPEEDDQVPALTDQREDLVYSLQTRLDDSLSAFLIGL